MQHCVRASAGATAHHTVGTYRCRLAPPAGPCQRTALPLAHTKLPAAHRRRCRVDCRSTQGAAIAATAPPVAGTHKMFPVLNCSLPHRPAGPAAAPTLSDSDSEPSSTSGWRPPRPPPPPPQGPSPLRQLYKRTLKQLSNLKLALAELAVIAALSAVGTVIKQGETYEFYMEVSGGLCGVEWCIRYVFQKLMKQLLPRFLHQPAFQLCLLTRSFSPILILPGSPSSFTRPHTSPLAPLTPTPPPSHRTTQRRGARCWGSSQAA